MEARGRLHTKVTVNDFTPVMVAEMTVQCVAAKSRPHFFYAACQQVYFRLASFWSPTICASNVFAVVE
jgi:hypothetical protein